jgi:hypothetical protein
MELNDDIVTTLADALYIYMRKEATTQKEMQAAIRASNWLLKQTTSTDLSAFAQIVDNEEQSVNEQIEEKRQLLQDYLANDNL